MELHGSSWGACRRRRGRGRAWGGWLLGEEAPWGWLLRAAGCPYVLSVSVVREKKRRRKEKGERRGKRKRKENKRKKGKEKYGKFSKLQNFHKIKDNL
jgi:hypothetical protein